MGYFRSQLDKDNFRWFENNKTINSLVGIKVENGNIRGIFPCEIKFSYPISAFVGENGSGKSTLLAMAACAFHNNDDYRQFSRKKAYFTYGDFFTFSPEERGLQGIEIKYTIRQNSSDIENVRRKKPSGKWNDFNTRKNRRVIYLGINRIVPPSESSVHKSYKKAFSDEGISPSVLNKLKTMASRIFGRSYSDLKIQAHNSYRLFMAERNELSYSGFNMGAGENTVISILLELLLAGRGTLMVIDEIELGLHAKAQKEFIEVLKEICKDNQCQIICSTHSKIILGSLPPEGRFFIQSHAESTIITPEISPEYAFGKLAGHNSQELDVFVEDKVAAEIIKNLVPMRIRERIQIYAIGSDQAILKQIAARYREHKDNYICFFDGDKRLETVQQVSQIKRHLETNLENDEEFDAFIESRLCYIPGENWPENHIIESLLNGQNMSSLSARWDIADEEVIPFLEQALAAPKHKEFHVLAERLSMDEQTVLIDCIKSFKENYPDSVQAVCSEIDNVLDTLK